MYIVSNSFANAMKTQPYEARLTLDGMQPIQSDAVQDIVFRGGTNSETDAFALGGTVAGSVEIVLDKTKVPAVGPGQQIKVELGMELSTGEEWLPMGVYYVTEPLTDDDRLTLKACDALGAKFEKEYEPLAGFAFDADIGVDSTELLKAICERRGVVVDASNLDPIMLHTSPDGFTERQIIGFIAALYGGFAHVDRAGVLRICTFRRTNQKVTADDYYEDGMVKAEYTYTVQWIKCFNEITELTMIMGDATAKQGIYLENIWMDNMILSKLWEQLQGFSYVPIEELSFLGNPLIDPGDIIAMEDLSGGTYQVPVMGITHEYDGGIITKVTAYGQAEAKEQTGGKDHVLRRAEIKAKTYSGIALEDAKKYADNLDKALDQLEVLKRLTNEEDDAIYLTKDGKLAIKATAILAGVLDAALVTVKNIVATNIVAGILKSKDEKAFYLDLDEGVLKMQAREFSVAGKTVQQIADAAGTEKAQAAVAGMGQMDVFNKLFDNGNVQGFEIVNGKLYINGALAVINNLIANNIVSGKLLSKDKRTIFNLDNGEIVCEAADGDKVVIKDGQLFVQDQSGIGRLRIVKFAENSYAVLLYGDTGQLSGGLMVRENEMLFGCKNVSDGSVSFQSIARQTINGVDYYVSP